MHPVLVAGAGPAGLATAALLRRRGIEPLVLDRAEELAAAWRSRYDRLHLHTIRWLSQLPGHPMPRSLGRWVSRDDFVAHLEEYAARQGLKPELGTELRRLDRGDGAWRATTSRGELDARTVVLATGFCNEPFVPPWPGRESFRRELVHSHDYRNPAPYAGRDVLVVGSGNSAAEIALDLAEGGAARVRIAVRTPPNIVRRDTFGFPSQLLGIALRRAPEPVLNRVGAALRRLTIPDLRGYGLPAPPGDGYSQFVRTGTVPILDVGFVAAVRERRIEVVAAVEACEGDEVVLADGGRLAPDAVVAATGFRPALEPVVGHLGILDAHGVPLVHGAQEHPRAPGLHFVGLSIQLSGLLREIAREAAEVAGAIAAHSGRGPTELSQAST
jgi:cation diffusion facilitator CzcD-associated flavoprotein CzcO